MASTLVPAVTQITSSDYVVEPWWARAHQWYRSNVPNHVGKRRVLAGLHRVGLRAARPFLWKMENGNYVAIEPREGLAPWSVGWTCFQSGRWEPHVEHLLEQRVQTGSHVMDIGANIGYFSAVMARQVGPQGRVFSFEPVPSTYKQLCLCRSFNKLDQLTPLNLALGNQNTTAELHFDPSMMGSASLHGHMSDAQRQSATVQVRRLDDLWKEGAVTEPKLIKIDVEGHEYAVFEGARALLSKARPEIVFEYNRAAAMSAGWDLARLVTLLRDCCDYRFFQVTPEGNSPIDPASFEVNPEAYVDLLALPPDGGAA
jgi:FkbM family methyltransferase